LKFVTLSDWGKSSKIGKVEIKSDDFMVAGNANGRHFKMLEIGFINPKERLKLEFSARGSSPINFEVVSLKKTYDRRILKKPNEVVIPFSPPFNMQVESISLVMKKVESD
ncbi:MAG: hypothetical protein R3313_03860, partial [Candidatus Saccharimonadales bacterium]|nr:hypothetical protein [Candidatus Saccharimonadales bacterium]